jgi:hypothetical protein
MEQILNWLAQTGETAGSILILLSTFILFVPRRRWIHKLLFVWPTTQLHRIWKRTDRDPPMRPAFLKAMALDIGVSELYKHRLRVDENGELALAGKGLERDHFLFPVFQEIANMGFVQDQGYFRRSGKLTHSLSMPSEIEVDEQNIVWRIEAVEELHEASVGDIKSFLLVQPLDTNKRENILRCYLGIMLEDGPNISTESPQWSRLPAFLSVVDEYIEQMYEGLFLKLFALGIFLRFLLPIIV